MDLATYIRINLERFETMAQIPHNVRTEMERLFPCTKNKGTVVSQIVASEYDYKLMHDFARLMVRNAVPTQRMRDALDYVHFRIYEVQEDGRVLLFNEAVCNLTIEQFLFVVRNTR